MSDLKAAASAMGKKGGSAKTEAKIAASKENGKKGGRPRKDLPKSIIILGKRWFDSVNGNTYCSSRTYFDGLEVSRQEWEYGYGNFYAQAATTTLKKLGLIKLKEHESLWQYCDRNKIELLQEHTDGLKRDMIEWGKKDVKNA